MLSRQEELKERARLLLEQARRDAAMKAGNKNVPNSATTAPARATNAADVSHSGVCVCVCVWMNFSLALHLKQYRRVKCGVVLRCDTSGDTIRPDSAEEDLKVGLGLEPGVFDLCLVHCVKPSQESQLCVPVLSLHALEYCAASPQRAGAATRVTSSLFSALMSLPQLCICCSLHLQHAGKSCPTCLILWQATLVNPS